MMNITASHSLLAVSHIAVAVSPLAFLLYVFMTGLMLELGRRAAQTLMRALFGCTMTKHDQQQQQTVINPTPEFCVVTLSPGDYQRQERNLCDSFNMGIVAS